MEAYILKGFRGADIVLVRAEPDQIAISFSHKARNPLPYGKRVLCAVEGNGGSAGRRIGIFQSSVEEPIFRRNPFEDYGWFRLLWLFSIVW